MERVALVGLPGSGKSAVGAALARRLGWRHVVKGKIVIKQNKTGAAVEVPIVQELYTALDLCPRDRLTFIAQADGRPLLAESFGAAAERVRTPPELTAALTRAFKRRDGPTLIEVPVGQLPSPWEFIRLPRLRGRSRP